MAITDFVLNLFGTIAYDDDSHGSFESTFRQSGEFSGVVAQHSSEDSKFHFAQLLNDRANGINALLAELPGSVILTYTSVTPDKNVNSFVMNISGTVTYDDNTSGSFAIQWVDGIINVFPSEATRHWYAITLESPGAILNQIFNAVAGDGNSNISY